MITHPNVAIAATTTHQYQDAKDLAIQWQLPLVSDPLSETAKQYPYLLLFTPDFLGLQKTSDKQLKPFYIDFLSGKLLYRSKQAGLRKELLARAIGRKPSEGMTIVDATAGLGRDSFILATLGFTVTLLERSPILYLLLQDALSRAQAHPAMTPTIQRMRLIHTDALSWLKNEHNKPDIIYLDPMFPQRQKSASVKKEMVILQELLGKDEDADRLFELAMTCAAHRVVVKRPRTASNIAECAPNFTFMGKSSRFDIYLTLGKQTESE